MTKFQWLAMLICGIGNGTDAVEVMSLSYILPQLQSEEGTSVAANKNLEGGLSSAVFIGMLMGGLIVRCRQTFLFQFCTKDLGCTRPRTLIT